MAAALALSATGNAALGWAWVEARVANAAALAERDEARRMASACSDATADLRELADRRAAEARKAQAAARTAAIAREQMAQTILSTPAAIAGNDCGSARVRVDRWLAERGQAQ